MNISFAGKSVIVTGAARGVGRSLVHSFLGSGCTTIVAADRDEAGLLETVTGHEEHVVSVVADISTQAGANSIIDTAVDRFGGLDVCVNNAAVAPMQAFLDYSVDVWDTVYAVNCRGTFLMTQAAGRAMIKGQRKGRIVNFSSGSAKTGGAGAAAYASSRAATEALGRVAAIALGPYDILVNTVSPGLIDTQPKPLPPGMKAGLEKRIPMLPLARAGEPEEVANVVLFLASEFSSYVTGAVWEVDGAAGVGSRAPKEIVDEDVRYDWVTGTTRG